MAREREILGSIPFIREPYHEQPPVLQSTQLRPIYEYKTNRITNCLLISDCKVPNSKKGLTMTPPSRNEMVRSLESLKNTPLSIADVTAIAAYPDEVIAYADRCAMKKGSLANPIGYFLVC